VSDVRRLVPAQVAELADLIGMDATLALVREHGGLIFYVPKYPGAEHPLRALIGGALDTLSEIYGNEQLRLPRCARWLVEQRRAAVLERLRAGKSIMTVAREFKMTMRHVWRIKAHGGVEDAADPEQLDLFSL
jgi:hypothetical protein